MDTTQSDALVFFGTTGDLAYKKIFPSLQARIKRSHLEVPVIGVAKAGWNLEQLKARAKDRLEKHGGLDPAAFVKLSGLRRYADGDSNDSTTFAATRKELGAAKRQAGIAPNHFRFRVSPQIAGTFGMNAVAPDSDTDTQPIELSFRRELGGQDMDAYEHVRTDAMNGDATLFARQECVEGAWRVVDPAL